MTRLWVRGMTLIELILAAAISLVIVLALGQIDVARVRMSRDVSQRSQGSGETSLLVASLVKDLERADRLVLLTPACQAPVGPPLVASSCVQIRIPEVDTDGPVGGPNRCPATQPPTCTTAASPDPCCLDQAGNYRWIQYLFRPGNQSVEFYNDSSGACNVGDRQQIFQNVSGLTVSYVDEATAPLGALGVEPLPGGNDNNVVQVDAAWTNPLDPAAIPVTVTSEVVLRATPYTNYNNPNAVGLDVSGVSAAPTPCT